MQRWRSHLATAVLAAAVGFLARHAFSPGSGQPSTRAEQTGVGARADTAVSDTTISAADTLPRSPGLLLDHASADLTGDGRAERIELYADVERDARGRLMWDDGQRWMLVVRRDAAVYPIFDRFVQLGHVRFWAIEHSGDAPPLLVQVAAGSGVQLLAYAYDAARDGFVLVNRVQSSGNVVHVTPHTAF